MAKNFIVWIKSTLLASMANFVYFFSLFDLETITLCIASTQQVMQILTWLVVLKNKLKSEILNVNTLFRTSNELYNC